jgi:hypothetical protein
MALNGTLKDMGLVALLQFPNAGRRSGRVTIESDGETALFYYSSGRLVHAQMGELSGEEVLVQVVDWTDGAFRFEPGIQSDTQTIEKDLHRTIMWALKERDERKKALGPAKREDGLSTRLSQLIGESERFVHACVISPSGKTVASTRVPKELDGSLSSAVDAVAAFLKRYGQAPPAKMLVEDEAFSLVLGVLETGNVLLGASPPGTRMGMLPLALSKLMEGLGQED